jgi:hypothetical protein
MTESVNLLDTQRSALEASAAAGGLVKDGGRWKRADGRENGTYATATLRKLYALDLVRLDEVNGRAEITAKGAEMAGPGSTDDVVLMNIASHPAGRPETPAFGLAEPMPYPHEVQAWEAFFAAANHAADVEELLADSKETLERLRRLLGGRLPTDGTYDVSFVDGGELVRQINEGLQVMARDIHTRPQAEDGRKVSVTIKAEPSENSAAVKFGYEVNVKLAKGEGTGLAYIDAKGRLVQPENVSAEQIMLPLSPDDKPDAAVYPCKAA